MVRAEKLGRVIATRKIDVYSEDGKRLGIALVKLGKPRKVRGIRAYRCYFQILGIGNESVRYAAGADEMQALILSLTKIGSILYNSDEAEKQCLFWSDSVNLGFPAFVDEFSSDFVPEAEGKLLL